MEGSVLRRTFCHVPGLGRETERALWQQGCLDWTTYLEAPAHYSVGSASRPLVQSILEGSVQALDSLNHQFFAQALGSSEAWRAWPEFQSSTAYLDIETDGGDRGDSVTLIGLHDANGFRFWIKGEDLESFRDVISHYGMIVTFFGSGFDLPMLQKCFQGLRFDQIHLDLCFALRKLGYRGGLKKIEKQLGISRGEDTDGLSGLDAVRLWRAYQRGSDEALETLIAYNREDVVNLETLANIAYRGLSRDLVAGV